MKLHRLLAALSALAALSHALPGTDGAFALESRQNAAKNASANNATTSTSTAGGGGHAEMLLQGLKALKFNALAGLLQNYTDMVGATRELMVDAQLIALLILLPPS